MQRRREGDLLARLLHAWAALQRGDQAGLSSILAEGVVWRGVLPGQVCNGRHEVMDFMVPRGHGLAPVTRMEAEEIGDRVAVSVRGPAFPKTEVHEADDPRSLVFTFRDGLVVRIDSFATPEAALQMAAG